MTATDDDRALAIIPRHRGDCDFDWHTGPSGPGCTCGAERERAEIAAALAAERDKARAPFLALADELDPIEVALGGFVYVADEIRRAAGVDQ